jgi:predicted transcriptional regulator
MANYKININTQNLTQITYTLADKQTNKQKEQKHNTKTRVTKNGEATTAFWNNNNNNNNNNNRNMYQNQ